MFRRLALALLLALALPGPVLAADPTPDPAVPVQPQLGAPCPPVEYVNGVPVIPDNAPSDCMYIQGGGMLGGETPVSEDPCAPLSDGSIPEMCQSAPVPVLFDAPIDAPTESCVTNGDGEEVCAALFDTVGGMARDITVTNGEAMGGIGSSELALALIAVLAGLVGYLFGARRRGAAASGTPTVTETPNE